MVCPLRGQLLESRLAAQRGVISTKRGSRLALQRRNQGEAIMKQLDPSISCAPIESFGLATEASGSANCGGIIGCRGIIGHPTASASQTTTPVSRPSFRISSRRSEAVAQLRVVARNKRRDNNGLEQTRRVGVPRLRGAVVRVPPCSSTRCYPDARAPR